MNLEEAQCKLRSGKLSLDDINLLKDVLEPCQWSILRGEFNDMRFQELERGIIQITAELDMLYNNHLNHIRESFKVLNDSMNKLGIPINIGVDDETKE